MNSYEGGEDGDVGGTSGWQIRAYCPEHSSQLPELESLEPVP